jgi:hypothetical protein
MTLLPVPSNRPKTGEAIFNASFHLAYKSARNLTLGTILGIQPSFASKKETLEK